MKSPFVFDVASLLNGSGKPEQRHQVGSSPVRIGPEMIAISEGGEVDVDATFIPLGGGISVEATVSAAFKVKCARCLTEFSVDKQLHISEVFSNSADFITGDEGEDDDVQEISGDRIDLLQSVIDEAGLNLPFNPVCADFGVSYCTDSDVPEPDGESGVDVIAEEVDPRWAGLEKFL